MEQINKTKEPFFLTIIKWIFSLFFIIVSIIVLIRDQIWLAIFSYLMVGLLLFPPLKEFWRRNFPFLKNKFIKFLVVFGIFMLSALAFN